MLDRIQNPMHFRSDKFILKLSSEECNLLISLLSSAISDTRDEINQTDKYELSDEIKSELLMMEKLLASIIDTSMVGNRPPASIH
jgi:hypothetical protein